MSIKAVQFNFLFMYLFILDSEPWGKKDYNK